MSRRMMMLFENATAAKEHIKSLTEMDDKAAERYVTNNTARKNDDNKLWVILP